jgi:hypothetical protein
VRCGLADGQRAGQRQVFQHRSRGPGQLASRPVTTMERQVHGMEQLSEPVRLSPISTHGNSFPAS